jgi:hypothetical protein
MATADTNGVAGNDWVLSEPWLWMAVGLACSVAAWVWALALSEAASGVRVLLLVVGFLSTASALIIRLSSDPATHRHGQLPRLASRILACVFSILALTSTLLLVLRMAGLNVIPWRPGILSVLWLIVVPASASAAWTCLKRRDDVDSEAAALLLCAAATCVCASLALYLGKDRAEEWDTIRLLFAVMALVALMAAPVAVAPQTVRRRFAGLLIVLHFGAIGTVALRNMSNPWIVQQLWTRIYRPYLDFMALNEGYGYFAPDPGPTHYLWFRLAYEDDQDKIHGEWYKVPEFDDRGFPSYASSLTYERMRTLTTRTQDLLPTPPDRVLALNKNGEVELRDAAYLAKRKKHAPDQPDASEELLRIPFHPNVPLKNQYEAPARHVRQMLESYVRHVSHRHRPEHPDWKLLHVKVYRVVHITPPDTLYLHGADPTDPEFYRPYYLGQYTSAGELMEPEDPFLYWLMPVYRDNQGRVHDWARRHAGDDRWIAVLDPGGKKLEWVSAPEPAFDSSSIYQKETADGFQILIHPDVLKHKDECAEMRKELQAQLQAVVHVMPARPLATLRKVRIWVEWEKKKSGAAEFHPSAAWLREHGYNPEKAGCVELCNTRNFVKWSRGEQPWMVLHELAHAYHFLVLGENHAGIKAAYKQAVDRKLYQSVAYVKGGKRKAYAVTNSKEYFAELSEAYFGKNDFYPFVRGELKGHDPVGYRLMEEAWGKLRDGKTE